MKNLKKITRNDLKSIKGGGIGDDCFAQIIPGDQIPEDGGYACPCNLVWCPNTTSCIWENMYDEDRCVGTL